MSLRFGQKAKSAASSHRVRHASHCTLMTLREPGDRERYQTIFADHPGAVAAPTAGLHFTPEVLAALDAAAVERAFVTLHVGLGTFKPITSETLEDHAMHAESYAIDVAAADAINRAKADGRRRISKANSINCCNESRRGWSRGSKKSVIRAGVSHCSRFRSRRQV